MYEYRILDVLRVVDGDTLDAQIALGFGISATLRFRLAWVDTAEIYGVNASAAGQEAKEFTIQWLGQRHGRLTVATFKGAQGSLGIGDGAFGRWLGDVRDDQDESLSAALVREFGEADLTFKIP